MNFTYSSCSLFINIFKVQYLLKWVGFANSENTWEPVEQLDCEDLIKDFEISRASRILAANENISGENDLIFLMQWKETELSNSPVSFTEAQKL